MVREGDLQRGLQSAVEDIILNTLIKVHITYSHLLPD